MAKKNQKDQVVVESELDGVERYLRTLEGTRKGAMLSGDDLLANPPMVIPISPSMDSGLGGVPEGSWVSITGPEKIGKTTLALSFAAQCQRLEYGERTVVYVAAEHRLKPRDLQGIRGLRTDRRHFVLLQSDKDKVLSTKDFLDEVGRAVSDMPGCVVVIDSVSAMCSTQVRDGGVGTADYGSGNRLTSQFIDIYLPIVKINRCIMVGIIQQYVNAGGMQNAPRKNDKVATRWKYQSDVAVKGITAKPWRADPNNDKSRVIGLETLWRVMTTATNAIPSCEVTSHIRFGLGIDRVYEAIAAGKDLGFLEASGAWYTFRFLEGHPELLAGTEFEGKPKVQAQGAVAVYQLLEKHSAWQNLLLNQITEVMVR